MNAKPKSINNINVLDKWIHLFLFAINTDFVTNVVAVEGFEDAIQNILICRGGR